jgi:hypothetical protein
MPIYDFQNRAGDVREFIVPATVSEIDEGGAKWCRVYTPTVPGLVGIPQPKPNADGAAIAGYKHMEDRDGSRFRSRYTKKQLKKIWSE